MQKRNLFVALALAVTMLFSVSMAFANQNKAPQAAEKQITPLDEENLKKNIISRLGDMTKSQEFINFSQDNIIINSKTGVTIGDSDYWVVRLGAKNLPQITKDDSKNISMDVIVDPTGTYQIFDIHMVAHQGSLFAEAKREMNKIKQPEGFGTVLFTGKGTADVLFISDPFCHYCQEEFKLLSQNKDNVRIVRIVHFPQMQPSSLIVSSFLMFAKEKFNDEKYLEIMNYAYSSMQPQSDNIMKSIKEGKQHPVTALERDALSTLIKKFPECLDGKDEETFYYLLKGKYATLIEEERTRLKEIVPVSGTPVTVINGVVVRGFNEPELKSLLKIQ